MSKYDLRVAQVQFENQIEELLESRKKLYEIREKFVGKFTPQFIENMPLELYTIGNKEAGGDESFCYIIERKLEGLGSIGGSNAFKFGIYYGKTKSEPEKKYRFAKKFGSDYQEAFENVKKELLRLIKAGKDEDLNGIVKNRISPMFKGKILSTYYPERYLNIFSNNHLEYYLIQLNLDSPKLIEADPVFKREALFEFKSQDDVMKKWSLDLFATFLYRAYPGSPTNQEEIDNQDPLEEYRNPDFPKNPNPEWIDLEIKTPNKTNSSGSQESRNSNPDYEKDAKKLKWLGNRGEKIVFEQERKRLLDQGKENLAERVERAKYDYLGYDIKSFEKNGEPRFIEVKATRSKVGTANFFLSVNELNKAKELPNYYVYMVFDVLSKRPKIWKIKNPFKPEKKMLSELQLILE